MLVDEPVNLIKVPLPTGKRCWSMCVLGTLCELTVSKGNRKELECGKGVLPWVHSVPSGKPLTLSELQCFSAYGG